MEQAWVNIVTAQEPVVFGRQLLPFSLSHAYTLMVCGSPYLAKEPTEPTLADLGLGVLVCSMPCWPFARVARWLRDPEAQAAAGRLAEKHAGSAQSVRAGAASFAEYLAVARTSPELFHEEGEGGRLPPMPWPLSVALRLIPLVGEERTWTMPLPLAFGYKLTQDWLGGSKALHDPDEFPGFVEEVRPDGG